MTTDRRGAKHTGRLGENLACEALAKRGYELVERNWRCAHGEVDIVARDGSCWVFAEVKTRRGRGAGLPEESLTEDKLTRLAEVALAYLGKHDAGQDTWRLDVVAVELGEDDRVRRLTVHSGLGPDW